MTENYNTATRPASLIQDWLSAGFTNLIPIAPPGAPLHENSRIDPSQLGKVPSDFYGGRWDSMPGWQTYKMTQFLAERWDGLGANVGLPMGDEWCALDVDVLDDLLAQAMLAEVEKLGGRAWFVRWGLRPKFLVLFRIQPGETVRRRQYPIKLGDVTLRIEVMGKTAKGTLTQAVVGGMHPSGSHYTWNNQPSADQVQPTTAEQMDGLVERMLRIAESRGWTRGKASHVNAGAVASSELGAEPFDVKLVAPLVDLIQNPDLEYDDWISTGYAIKSAMGGGGWELWERFSAKANKHSPADTQRAWDSFNPDGSAGMGRLVYLARQASGGELPGDLETRVKIGWRMKQAQEAGLTGLVAGTTDAPIPMQQQPSPLASLPGYVPQQQQPSPLASLPAAAPAPAPATEPHADLLFNSSGDIVSNFANICSYMELSDVWSGVFRYDQFSTRHVVSREVEGFIKPERVGTILEDDDYGTVHRWFQRHLFPKCTRTDIMNAVSLVSKKNSYDPLRDYLTGLVWDGQPRISNLLSYYFRSVECDPARAIYVSQAGRKWMIGAVARAMRPGCQMDNALIFEGKQGKGKSSALKVLCPNKDWFGDSLPDFHKKDASEFLAGRWIIEMAELTQFKKGEVESMRAFLTRTTEVFRPSYGRNVITYPRHCVFAGSTNRSDYLRDNEGERRVWPVVVGGNVRVADLKHDRDQLWAEAYAAWQSGEQWHLTDAVAATAREIQQERTKPDIDEVLLREYVMDIERQHPVGCAKFTTNGLVGVMSGKRNYDAIRNTMAAMGYSKKEFHRAGDPEDRKRFWMK